MKLQIAFGVFVFCVLAASHSVVAAPQFKKKTTTKTSEIYTAFELPSEPQEVENLSATIIETDNDFKSTQGITKTTTEPTNKSTTQPTLVELDKKLSALEKKIDLITKEKATGNEDSKNEIIQSPSPKSLKTSPNYFDVPHERKASLTKRLKLVETILLKSGRAYDYRSMTTKQLEEILAAVSLKEDKKVLSE